MSTAIALKKFRAPQRVITFFTAKTILKSAVILGLFFGLNVALQSIAYAKSYPSEHDRAIFAATLGNNAGLSILYGKAHEISTVAGYTAWRCGAVGTLIGAIWALLFATKTFRGQEESGRWEMLLIGRTTPARATASALAGIGLGLLVIYTLTTLIILGVSKNPDVNFSLQGCLFFGLAIVAGVAEFLALGALVSQFAATRRKAVGYASAFFGIFFVLKALADVQSNLHWLIYASPLGWVELLQPLIGSRPIWLIPIGGFVLLCVCLTIFLAGRRDVGTSIIPDKDTAKARTSLLNSPLATSFRLARGTLLGWIIGTTAFVGLLSSVAKSASNAVSDSTKLQSSLSTLSQGGSSDAAILFLSMGFFVTMLAMLLMATSLIGAVRDEESKGYLDNFLVRQVSRVQWLSGRIVLAIAGVVSVGVAVSVVCWITSISQKLDVSFGTLLTAGANTVIPAIFMISLGIFLLGILPRIATMVLYTLIAWGFLLELIGSVATINHWILDTSLLHHVAFAPAADINWPTNAILLAIAVALAIIGTVTFTKRDLQAE